MNGSGQQWIGRQIGQLRDLAGLSQEQLGQAIGSRLRDGRPYTQQHIAKIEAGKTPVTQWPMLVAAAEVLRVPVTRLIGLPAPVMTKQDLMTLSAVEAIRRSLFYPPDEPVTPRPLAALVVATRQVMAARMACDYDALSAALPPLLTETRTTFEESDSAQAGELLARVAVTASLTLKPIGWSDLALQLADLARTVGRRISNPAAMAAGQFAYAQCVHGAGATLPALKLAAGGLADTPTDTDASRAWRGMLHLQAAYSASAAGDADLAEDHFGEANALADRVAGDPWLMEFHRSNVMVWRANAALQGERPERASELAARVELPALATRQRVCHLHMAAGRGEYLAGRPARAVEAFLAAHDAAPEELRTRPSVLEIVGQMMRDTPRGGSAELRRLAAVTGA